MSETCSKCGDRPGIQIGDRLGIQRLLTWVCDDCYEDDPAPEESPPAPRVEAEATLPVCPLCAQRRELLDRPYGVDEVAVCEGCWNSSHWFLRGDHDTVIVSPYNREQLEKLRRGEEADDRDVHQSALRDGCTRFSPWRRRWHVGRSVRSRRWRR